MNKETKRFQDKKTARLAELDNTANKNQVLGSKLSNSFGSFSGDSLIRLQKRAADLDAQRLDALNKKPLCNALSISTNPTPVPFEFDENHPNPELVMMQRARKNRYDALVERKASYETQILALEDDLATATESERAILEGELAKLGNQIDASEESVGELQFVLISVNAVM